MALIQKKSGTSIKCACSGFLCGQINLSKIFSDSVISTTATSHPAADNYGDGNKNNAVNVVEKPFHFSSRNFVFVATNIPCSQKFVKPKTQKNFNFLCVKTLYPLKRQCLQYGLETSCFFTSFSAALSDISRIFCHRIFCSAIGLKHLHCFQRALKDAFLRSFSLT